MSESILADVQPAPQEKDKNGEVFTLTSNISDEHKAEIYDISTVDPVLAKKIHLINNALDEIGMTPFHWKLFFLNGFGYAVDSVSRLLLYFGPILISIFGKLLIVCQSISQPAVTQEYGQPSKYIKGVNLASQIGLLVGAVVWGFSADIIGRRLAFNTSLFICAIFVLIGGAMPNYISFAAM